eukprot:sb/3477934/
MALTPSFTQEDPQEEFGWKLVHGDVFRPPRKGMMLSVLIGSGAQVFFMISVTIGRVSRDAHIWCYVYCLSGIPVSRQQRFPIECWSSHVRLSGVSCWIYRCTDL